MSSYYADLNRIKKAGHQHALDHMANGAVEPEESLFSGEWAGGLTGQDALNYAGIEECTFSDLEDYEQTDVMDYFEDGYNSAPWPELVPAEDDHTPSVPVEPIKLGHHLTVTAPPFEEWLSDEVEFSLHTDPTWSYVVGYCHVDVGLMSYAAFDTLSDLYDWLETQGAEFVSAEDL